MQKFLRLIDAPKMDGFIADFRSQAYLEPALAELNAYVATNFEVGNWRRLSSYWSMINHCIPCRTNTMGVYMLENDDYLFLQKAVQYKVKAIDAELKDIKCRLEQYYQEVKQKDGVQDIPALAQFMKDWLIEEMVSLENADARQKIINHIDRVFQSDLNEPKRSKIMECQLCGAPVTGTCSHCKTAKFCGEKCFAIHQSKCK